ncbi:hypothetical protein AYI68_g2200 [Smittium mucronatum]|uniref:MICOS complex subunit n=1 Tax=Smittium mucronatum TaxID=133383 RepID=A0A1R0H3E0_9FUNG|nr:hypothetical protein AYI68_g2200 [Smittium mucronatum]
MVCLARPLQAQDYDTSVLRSKPIYDPPKPKVQVVQSPTRLQSLVAESRKSINSYYRSANQWMYQKVDDFVDLFTDPLPSFKNKGVTKDILSGNESFMPGALVLRVIASPLVFMTTTYLFFPKTVSNAVSKLSETSATFNSFAKQVSETKDDVTTSILEARTKISNYVSGFF